MSGRPRGASYRIAEDKALCEAWIQVNNDGGTGINQCGDEFYGRVKVVFDELVKEIYMWVQDRPLTSLGARFSTISTAVSNMRPDAEDEQTKEYVALKRRIVLARIRKEAAALESGTSITAATGVEADAMAAGSAIN
ncbi:hypothetical protein ON010_g6462 [Phytophthora cinnamomi]|nr:hypothetical protein ON010_g6462 [Phytophthora cinnamomi]